MRFAISSGHALYCRGARGSPVPPQLDEVDQARRVVDRVVEIMNTVNVVAVKFHDNTSRDQSTNLNTIVAWHNKQARDYDVSVHFNAYNGKAHGTEVWYYSQAKLAGKVSAAMAKAGGFTDRGEKYSNGLFFLMNCHKPAVLLEVCFCDNTADSNKFTSKFEKICQAIASSLSGVAVGEPPVETPPEQGWPDDPLSIPVESRPVVGKGDEGNDVRDLQKLLNKTELAPGLVEDGDFGNLTDTAARNYQASRGLDVDGIAGQQTWGALYENKPPMPMPVGIFTSEQQHAIMQIAHDSSIADYKWHDRGIAPPGYMQGMALAFAANYVELQRNHPAAIDMAKARTSSDKDALNIYRSEFDNLGMSNEQSGPDALRHLYALMLGHGMRESSGRHCEGRDQSASNTSSETAEAGLFQTSYNAHSASSPEFDNLMSEFSSNQSNCYLSAFAEGVSCSMAEWENYGSGDGFHFQKLCKECPSFAAETAALTLRNLANHYGPIVRQETELKKDADVMLQAVQDYVDSITLTA